MQAESEEVEELQNSEQIEVAEDSDENPSDDKKRGYDFVLPFRTLSWRPRVFVQCQFYAGDSGSVSHKNVDQTKTSRQTVLSFVGDAIFVEYVDGAGYFSSLNGDLKKLLRMPATKSFIQIRSAPIKLRRELQQLGFLLPIEVEHAIFTSSNGRIQDIKARLLTDGYSAEEVDRCLHRCIEANYIEYDTINTKANVRTDRVEVVRRYLLLDIIALYGSTLSAENITGCVIIPGYGPFHGMKFVDLAKQAIASAPILKDDLEHTETFLSDIQWLCEQGWAMSR